MGLELPPSGPALGAYYPCRIKFQNPCGERMKGRWEQPGWRKAAPSRSQGTKHFHPLPPMVGQITDAPKTVNEDDNINNLSL